MFGVCWLERGKDSFPVKPVKKRHYLSEKTERLEEKGLHAWLCCSSMGFVADRAKLYPSFYTHSLTTTSASSLRGDATHSHSPLCCLHTHAPTSLKTHTHELKCSEEMRAEVQGGVRSASSASLLFLHLCRSAGIITYLQDIALHSPLWQKDWLCVFVCYIYWSGPPRGQTVWVSGGLSESFATTAVWDWVDGTINRRAGLWQNGQKAGGRQTIWRRNCTSPPQRGHRYITSLYIRSATVVLFLIPSIYPFPLLLPSSNPSLLACSSWGMLPTGGWASGHRETRSKKKRKDAKSREIRVWMDEQRFLLLKSSNIVPLSAAVMPTLFLLSKVLSKHVKEILVY